MVTAWSLTKEQRGFLPTVPDNYLMLIHIMTLRNAAVMATDLAQGPGVCLLPSVFFSNSHCLVKDTLTLGSMGILKVENNHCGERLFATKITSFGGECTCETRMSILTRTFDILGQTTISKCHTAAWEDNISVVQFQP